MIDEVLLINILYEIKTRAVIHLHMIAPEYKIINIMFLSSFIVIVFRFALKLLHILNVLFFQKMVILIWGIVDRAANWPVDQSMSKSFVFLFFLIHW